MNLVAYALVTLDDTKTFLGITNNTQDEKLKMLINMATDYIESQTGRRFVSTVHTNEEFDGSGTFNLTLNHPIVSFTQLQVNSNFDNSDNWQTVDSSEYWIDNETGIITKISSFSDFDEENENGEALSDLGFQRGKNKYRATYTSGYSTVPYDLQFACMTIVGNLLNSGATGGAIKSESLGDHSVTYQDINQSTGGMSGGILEDVLSKYRDIPLAS